MKNNVSRIFEVVKWIILAYEVTDKQLRQQQLTYLLDLHWILSSLSPTLNVSYQCMGS